MSKIPHGESYAGKRHVVPLLCYGAIGYSTPHNITKLLFLKLKVLRNFYAKEQEVCGR